MFTGIVETTGTIMSTRQVPGGRRLSVDVGPMAKECRLGASLSVNGVCLTVADATGNTLAFDVIAETLETSTLGTKRVGDRVNLERSLQAAGRLDGHFVQGHIDGRATVTRAHVSPREYVIWLRPDATLKSYIIPKGSIAIDGVSLTIAAVEGTEFSVAFIPTTIESTTLSSLSVGDVVNIETDIIARTIIHHLRGMTSATDLTMETLREAGMA